MSDTENTEKQGKPTPYQNLSVEEKEGAQVAITGEIPYETLKPYRDAALEEAKQETEVDGFRKGHAPEDKVVEKLGGEEAVLWRAAERALGDVYPRIIQDQNIDAIGRPQVSVTQLATDNPLGFHIDTAVMPTVTLPDYTAVAAEAMQEPAEDTSVTDEEVEEVITQVRRQKAEQDKQSGQSEQSDGGGATLYDADGNPIQSDADDSSESEQSASESSEQEENLPELTDDFVKQLGNFETVQDLRDTVRQNLEKEKEQKEREKRRMKAAEAILEKTQMEIPAALVDSELEKMLGQFKQDVERMGAAFEDYLKQAGKTEEQLREEWRPEAEKRAKLQIILNKIAVAENLVPTDEEIQEQVNHLMQHYPNADEQAARAYAATILTNEKVFRLLEAQAPQEEKGEKSKEESEQQEENSAETSEEKE